MLTKENIKYIYRLSPLQEGIFYHHLLNPSSGYFNQLSFTVKGAVNLEIFKNSFQKIVDRYDVLRSVFIQKTTTDPLQIVLKEQVADYNFFKLNNSANRESILSDYKWQDRIKSFSLSEGKLMRLSVIQLDHDLYYCVWSYHHIIMDGWCISVLISEFFTFYNHYLNNSPAVLQPVIPYLNYIRWLDKIDKEESLNYWREYLWEYESLPVIPGKIPDATGEYEVSEVSFTLTKHLTEKLKILAIQQGVTLNIIIQSIWGVLLGKYNQSNDVVFGSVVSGRPSEIDGIEKIIGLFINTIPVRVKVTQDTSFLELLKKMHIQSISGAAHHYIQLADVQGTSLPGSKLFDHIIAFENYPVTEKVQERIGTTGGFPFTLQDVESFGQTNYSFNIIVLPGETLSIKFNFNRRSYNENIISSIKDHFVFLLEQLVSFPEKPIKSFQYITDSEKRMLLTALDNTACKYPDNKSLTELFEEQVNKTPESVALVYGSAQLTYQELNNKVNNLAHYLRKKYNIKQDELIGIIVDRSEWMIIGLLGILKAGGAYVPIDPSLPNERINYILKDASISLLLTDNEDFTENTIVENILDITSISYLENPDNPSAINLPSDLAYVIYTSGTTGNPKGMMIEQRNIVRLIINDKQLFDFSHCDVWTMFHSFNFDFSVWEMYGALLSGGKLVIVSKETALDTFKFLQLINKEKVTVLNQTPSAFHNLIRVSQHDGFSVDNALRYVIFGGEALHPRMLARWKETYPSIKLINMYGITETTVHVTYKEITEEEIASNCCNIGVPIPTLDCYVLDENQQLVPPGVNGELYVGGLGLGRGYVNKPELTREKFIPHPFKKGERLYRSGDNVRMLGNGELEYLGRKDNQVKIRGYRIELAEIEKALLGNPDVKEVVVIAKEDEGEEGSKYLVAYITSDQISDTEGLRKYLSTKIPSYMIPASFVQLEKMPLNSNGKIDKKVLLQTVKIKLSNSSGVYIPPSPVEERLLIIWKEILGIPEIGVKDNFFLIGGHSLKAVQLISRIKKDFGVSIDVKTVFANPTVQTLAIIISGAEEQDYQSIPHVHSQSQYPLSPSQKRLWVINQFEGSSQAYNMSGVLEFEGLLEKKLFEDSITFLINRHESLRTVFRTGEDGDPYQYIIPTPNIDFKLEFFTLTDPVNYKKEVQEQFDKAQTFVFNIIKGPLIRAVLIKAADNRHIFIFTIHHLVCDGWSIQVLIKEIIEVYNALRRNSVPQLRELRIQYKDYASWMHSEAVQKTISKSEEYWLGQFKGDLSILDLPYDYERPVLKTYNGRSFQKNLSPLVVTKFSEVCAKEGATLFMGLVSVLNTLFYRYTGQEDIILGTPVAGRDHPDLEDQIGLYLNTLAVRTCFSGEDSFLSLLNKTKKVLLDAYSNQRYPFDKLIEKLNLERDMSHSPLFDVLVILQNQATLQFTEKQESFEGLIVKNFEELGKKTSQFDITFEFAETSDKSLLLNITFNTDVYSNEKIIRLLEHFENLIIALQNNPLDKIKSINFLSDSEKQNILTEFNSTSCDYPRDKLIHQLFEENALRYPDRTAVKFKSAILTYSELNKKSNQVARLLRSKGVAPGQPVALMLERSVEMIIGIFGILKAGGAYVPIDPAYPRDRKEFILKDSTANILIIQDEFLKDLETGLCQVIFIGEPTIYKESTENLAAVNISDDIAYIIYTSGSTGTPKGVMIEHHSVVNRLKWMQKKYPLREHDVILQKTPYTFDVSVWELFWWAFEGAQVALLQPHGEKDPASIIEAVKTHQVSVLHFVPPMLNVFLDYIESVDDITFLDPVKQMFVSGEKLDVTTVSKFNRLLFRSNGAKLSNLYGPTEATVDVSFFDCKDEIYKSIPIGKPIDNTQLYILDNSNIPVPIGITGELYIGGAGVARGYINRDDLTKEKFVSNPFNPTERLYKTGDLARWRADGNIEYLGRTDHQVKVRGFRIELGEIENQLLNYKSVKEAVVLDYDAGADKNLCAFITSSAPLDQYELADFLSGKLPEYMVPLKFIFLEFLPLSFNGKTDRRALLKLVKTDKQEKAFIPPVSHLEKELAIIWGQVLEKENVGIRDNFFSLGGNSLKVIQLIAKINKSLNVILPVKEVFKHPTIEKLSSCILYEGRVKYNEIQVVPQNEYYELSHAQKRVWILSQMPEASISFNMPSSYLIEGNLELDAFVKTFEIVIDRHEILRTVFVEYMGSVKQKVLLSTEVNISPERIDLSQNHDAYSIAHSLADKEWSTAFDLSKGPLLRIKIIILPDNKYVFLLTMHHIISDASSIDILFKEIFYVYRCIERKQNTDLKPLRIQYKEFAAWENEQLADIQGEILRNFWLNELDSVSLVDFPTDNVRPEIRTYNGDTYSIRLDQTLTGRLKSFASDKDVTLFMILISVTNILLYKYTGRTDIVIGAPVSNRPHDDLQDQLGFYLNTVALRTRFSVDDNFLILLEQVKKSCLNAYEHQLYPFDKVVDDLQVKRDLSRHPLFDIMVDMINYMSFKDEKIPGLKITSFGSSFAKSKFDITLYISEGKEDIDIAFSYNTDLFDKETIELLSDNFLNLIENMTDSQYKKISEVILEDSLDFSNIQSIKRKLFLL